jgi:hypothetical protein
VEDSWTVLHLGDAGCLQESFGRRKTQCIGHDEKEPGLVVVPVLEVLSKHLQLVSSPCAPRCDGCPRRVA